MTTGKVIRIFAGAVVLISLALGAPANPLVHRADWLWMMLFVATNLFQLGFAGCCSLEMIPRVIMLPLNSCTVPLPDRPHFV
jgi:hypothetical protein